MGNSLNTLIFRPPPSPSYSKGDPHLHLIKTPGGATIASYFIKHKRARFTIIFSHGNAEDIGHVFNNIMHRISNWNCNVFIYDYPGYGLSDGVCSELGLYDCTDLSFKYLTKTLKINPGDVVAYGRSLGCCCAVYLGVKYKLAGVILQSPFLSIFRMKLPFSPPFDLFNNLERVRGLGCPTLVIHGEDDEVVPVSHSRELVRSIPEVFYHFIEGGSHNNLDFDFGVLLDACIIEFLGALACEMDLSDSNPDAALIDRESFPASRAEAGPAGLESAILTYLNNTAEPDKSRCFACTLF